MSTILFVAGLIALGIGSWAWTMGRPAPARVKPDTSTAVGTSPWFDAGATLFATRSRTGALPTPAELGCDRVTSGRRNPLADKADANLVGTRVVQDIAVFPVAAIGRTGHDDRIECGGALAGEVEIWVLPTSAAPSRTPLSLVIAGIGALGLGVLLHPRTRGARRGLA